MSVDDIVKLMLTASITFAIAGLAWQLMRLLASVTSSIQDLRKSIQNVGKATDQFLEDYQAVHEMISKAKNLVSALEENIGMPLQAISKLLSLFNRKNADMEGASDAE